MVACRAPRIQLLPPRSHRGRSGLFCKALLGFSLRRYPCREEGRGHETTSEEHSRPGARSSGSGTEPGRDPGSCAARAKPEGHCHWCGELMNIETSPQAVRAPLGRHSGNWGNGFGSCFALIELDGVGNKCGEVATMGA